MSNEKITQNPKTIAITEEMIPVVVGNDEWGMIRVMVDGNLASCFLHDRVFYTMKVVILFDEPHPRWKECFTTKYFIFKEPGKMYWGHRGEHMYIEAFKIPQLPEFPCVCCGSTIPWDRKRKVFCSDLCKEESKHVRYFRSCLSKGIQDRPDIKLVWRQRLAHLNSGGYIALGRRISNETRAKIREKFQNLCAHCNVETVNGEIDHISGSGDEISNLQLLCWDCHMEKSQTNLREVAIDDPRALEISEYNRAFFSRVHAKNPRICDDHVTWKIDVMDLIKKRREEYFQSLGEIVTPMIESGMSRYFITHRLNKIGVQTLSGKGNWGTTTTKQLVDSLNYSQAQDCS